MPTLQESVSAVRSNTDLTVIAQAIGIDDADPAGRYLFPLLFPFTDARGIDLTQLTRSDFRPVATHREFNAHGKEIALPTPKIQELTMVPIEARHGIGEEEMTRLLNMYGGNADLVQAEVMPLVDARVRVLVESVYRALEVQALEAWAKGTITAKNPTSGATYTVSLGFDSGRLQTAATAWDDGGRNAYNDFVAWYRDVLTDMDASGAAMSRLVYNAIQADAPNLADFGGQGVVPSQSATEQRISDAVGAPFRFVLNDAKVDAYADGGSATTRTRVWDESYVAALPASGQVGETHRAGVASAYEALAASPDAPIDVRGVGVRKNPENKGKYLDIMATALWLALPYEENVHTIDTGVNS